jgi:mannose-6-phosphate isomerase-like protein (cupin superfamily)
MRSLSLFLLLLATAMLPPVSLPEGFALWKGDAVKKSGEELATQLDDQKFGWKPLGTYGNHYLGISRREGDGSAEVHETQVDVWIVQDGEATLIVGGTMVQPKTVKTREIRGTSIDGGETKPLKPGDIVHIPVKVPHQLKMCRARHSPTESLKWIPTRHVGRCGQFSGTTQRES